ncbi:hypothetical protein JQX13_43525 [Archangium violaceum]|nr:hypothetical protein [Archangium violaceum]QRK06865.1 hypothetical protein JQX13_43525 [Archangium violaceum]
MFRYFPKNYVWNLSVDLALESALAADDERAGRLSSAGETLGGRTA